MIFVAGSLADSAVSGMLLKMRKSAKREFTVIVERDEDGCLETSLRLESGRFTGSSDHAG